MNSATDDKITSPVIHSIVPCSNCQTNENVHLVDSDTLVVVNVLNMGAKFLIFLCDKCLLTARQMKETGAPKKA